MDIKLKRTPPPLKHLAHPWHFLSFGFGSGYSPWAPGTAGTAAAIPIFYFMANLSSQIYLLLVLAMLLLGFYVCGYTTRAMGKHDHSAIVWDEIVGYLITMFSIPHSWQWMLVGFFVFRFFDVLKPWPINVIDRRIEGGVGIMLDDVLAGVYGLMVMQGFLYYFGR